MKKVLIADSSAINRSVQKDILQHTSHYEFCCDALSEKEIFEQIENCKPDVIIADFSIFEGKRIESVFSILKETKLPTILYVPQNFINYDSPNGIITITKPQFFTSDTEKIKNYALIFEQSISKAEKQVLFGDIYKKAESERIKAAVINANKKYEAVCIGVSTGGPGTILELLKSIGPNFPLPIFITQHIDSFFDKNLIIWLNANTPLTVELAEDNKIPQPGKVYFAPSDVHLTFSKVDENRFCMKLNHDEPVNFLRPSVDKMFNSAAEIFEDNCIAILLTGMGADGAEGCVKLKNKGSYTITQDEQSCVIYGMPKAAAEAGGSVEVLPLNKIAERIKQLCKV